MTVEEEVRGALAREELALLRGSVARRFGLDRRDPHSRELLERLDRAGPRKLRRLFKLALSAKDLEEFEYLCARLI